MATFLDMNENDNHTIPDAGYLCGGGRESE